MHISWLTRTASLAVLLATSACASGAQTSTTASPVRSATGASASTRSPVANTRQLLVVTTPGWDSTSGTLRRYARTGAGAPWRQVGVAVPIVVGRTGLAWDDALGLARPGEPLKREGDGRAPAGAFALDTAFGFDIRQTMPWVRLPYLQLRQSTECVDDAGFAVLQHDRRSRTGDARRLEERRADARDRPVPTRRARRIQLITAETRPRLVHLPAHLGRATQRDGRMHGDGCGCARADRSMARPSGAADDRAAASQRDGEPTRRVGAALRQPLVMDAR